MVFFVRCTICYETRYIYRMCETRKTRQVGPTCIELYTLVLCARQKYEHILFIKLLMLAYSITTELENCYHKVGIVTG